MSARRAVRKARFAAVPAAIALWGCAAGGGGAEEGPGAVAAPTSEDCVVIKVWSNGYHTALALPGDAFGPDHPVRALFPDRSRFLVGFGDLAWYQAGQTGVAAAIRAAAAPSPAVVHVIAGDEPVEERLWRPSALAPVAVSREGLAAIADGIASSIELAPAEPGGAPRPVVVGPGRVPETDRGGSVFVAATESFHLFNMCNHWTAARLAAAGVEISPGSAMRAGPVMAAARAAPTACPTPP